MHGLVPLLDEGHYRQVESISNRALTGILCTFDTIKRDAEIKLLLGCTESDVHVIRAFLSKMRTLYVPRSKEEN